MEERLKAALRDLGYADDEIFLEPASGGRIGGYIISEAFRGESQMNRQDQLWAGLQKRLTPEDLDGIAAILTMTPAEAAS